MNIDVRKNYHSRDLLNAVREAWTQQDRLLIVTPPFRNDDSYVSRLRDVEWGPEKPLFGVFTSGTVSGQPRLVLYSRKNIESALEAVLSVFDRKRITSVFGYPQPFHTFGLTLGYLLAESLKVPLHFHDGKYCDESHALRASIDDPGLLTLGTPAHFYDLVRSNRTLAPSYSAIMGGASVDPQLWRDTRDRLQIEAPSIGYGCTEASPAITHLGPGIEPREIGEIGVPLKNLESRVINGKGVEIQGASLCLAMLDANGIHFPKSLTIADDIVVRDDGRWVFKGRLDLTINRGGVKIALEDVERAMKDKLNLTAIAFGIPSERLGQDLGIAVQERSDEVASLIGETFHLKPQLKQIEKFPLNASGKIDRQEISSTFNVNNNVDVNINGNPNVSVSALLDFLPHRPPAVWLDEVGETTDKRGESFVTLRADAPYMSNGQLRRTSMIEFIAQSFGYQQAARAKRSNVPIAKASKAFLVSVTKCSLKETATLKPGDRLKIAIEDVNTVGPVVLFNSLVTDSHGNEYARASLKVFAEP